MAVTVPQLITGHTIMLRAEIIAKWVERSKVSLLANVFAILLMTVHEILME